LIEKYDARPRQGAIDYSRSILGIFEIRKLDYQEEKT
jgi:hypothetical protein